jgi:hypothetical protein
MSEDLRDAIVRLLNSKNETVGTGFLVRTTNEAGGPLGSAVIVTCAHVIEKANATSGEEVGIRYLMGDLPARALIKPEWWRPSEQRDIAVLQPVGSIPLGSRLLELGDSSGTAGW